MRKTQKLISKIFSIFLPFFDRMAYLQYFNQPFTNLAKSNLQEYYNLAKSSEKNTFSIEDVDNLEKKTGYSINRHWLKSLACKHKLLLKNQN